MGPEHANLYGNVHGGVIMKLVDEAAALAAMRHAQRPCVTVALDSMMFHSPVHVGQLLSCTAMITYVGRTSIEVSIIVHAEDVLAGQITHTNDEERSHWDSGRRRQQDRLRSSRPVKRD